MNILQIKCDSCKVSGTCPRKGSSPSMESKKVMLCRLLDGYGRDPIDTVLLSEESKARALADGPCLTIAEIPTRDESGSLVYEVTKIFHHPIRHARETVAFNTENMIARSNKP